MSPRMSKTMVRPSGETSQLIQVPSSVSNSTLVEGPWSPSTSHGSGFFADSCNCSIFFCASCSCLSLSCCWLCARAGANVERATERVRRSAWNLLDTVSPQGGGFWLRAIQVAGENGWPYVRRHCSRGRAAPAKERTEGQVKGARQNHRAPLTCPSAEGSE